MSAEEAALKAQNDIARLYDASKQGAGAVQAVFDEIMKTINSAFTPSVDIAMQTTEEGVWKTYQAVDALKVKMAEPVNIVITYDINHPLSKKADELAKVASSSDAVLSDMIRSFLERNQGDRPRIPSALGIPMDTVARLGFASGTFGRYMDFGSGTWAMLHGRERISTEREGREESGIGARLDSLERFVRDQPRAIAVGVRDALVLAGAV
jgi:hypothetical protein